MSDRPKDPNWAYFHKVKMHSEICAGCSFKLNEFSLDFTGKNHCPSKD